VRAWGRSRCLLGSGKWPYAQNRGSLKGADGLRNKKREALRGFSKPMLIRFLKGVCLAEGKPTQHSPGRPLKVRVMVESITGRDMRDAEAWTWLVHRYEDAGMPYVGAVAATPLRRPTLVPASPPAPPNPGFYDSRPWRDVRYRALKLSDGCCVLCGRSRREHGVVLHVDHIKPRSKHPALELALSNLQVLCEDCNLGKSNRDDTDWRADTIKEVG
jgi:hypothetical protein